MNAPEKNVFAPLSAAYILLDIILFIFGLIVSAIIMYAVFPAETITDNFLDVFITFSMFPVAIISGIIYAKRHHKVFMRGEFHYLIVLVSLALIHSFIDTNLIRENPDAIKFLHTSGKGIIIMFFPIFLGAWTGGFIGSLLFYKTNPPEK